MAPGANTTRVLGWKSKDCISKILMLTKVSGVNRPSQPANWSWLNRTIQRALICRLGRAVYPRRATLLTRMTLYTFCKPALSRAT